VADKQTVVHSHADAAAAEPASHLLFRLAPVFKHRVLQRAVLLYLKFCTARAVQPSSSARRLPPWPQQAVPTRREEELCNCEQDTH